MVDSENKVPGISFWLANDKSSGLMDGTGKSRVECTLIGEYTDEDLWKKIQKRMGDGFRVYGEEDFQGEVLLMMRDDYQKEIKAHEVTQHALRLEIAKRMYAEEQLADYKRILGSLGSALGKR